MHPSTTKEEPKFTIPFRIRMRFGIQVLKSADGWYDRGRIVRASVTKWRAKRVK